MGQGRSGVKDKQPSFDLGAYMAERARAVDEALGRFLPEESAPPETLHKAMRYSVFAGGKRLRPVLVIAGAEAVGGSMNDVMPTACAVEMIHTYSLIHDDLPAMDNDDFLPQLADQPQIFGEALAILAGDALTLPFGSSPTMFRRWRAGRGSTTSSSRLPMPREAGRSADRWPTSSAKASGPMGRSWTTPPQDGRPDPRLDPLRRACLRHVTARRPRRGRGPRAGLPDHGRHPRYRDLEELGKTAGKDHAQSDHSRRPRYRARAEGARPGRGGPALEFRPTGCRSRAPSSSSEPGMSEIRTVGAREIDSWQPHGRGRGSTRAPSARHGALWRSRFRRAARRRRHAPWAGGVRQAVRNVTETIAPRRRPRGDGAGRGGPRAARAGRHANKSVSALTPWCRWPSRARRDECGCRSTSTWAGRARGSCRCP